MCICISPRVCCGSVCVFPWKAHTQVTPPSGCLSFSSCQALTHQLPLIDSSWHGDLFGVRLTYANHRFKPRPLVPAANSVTARKITYRARIHTYTSWKMSLRLARALMGSNVCTMRGVNMKENGSGNASYMVT